jgi:uncharacterized protein YndB with AHSA1/START domain
MTSHGRTAALRCSRCTPIDHNAPIRRVESSGLLLATGDWKMAARAIDRILVRVLACFALLAAAGDAAAQVMETASEGFLIRFNQRVDAPPGKVYATIAGVERWWSSAHTYSGDAANLSLKAEAAACFCERWKDGSVEHGRVVLALRDRFLRISTALGPLQGKAVSGILSFQLQPADGGTSLTLAYRVNGAPRSALDKDAPAVEGVLKEQFERLVRLIGTGVPDAAGEAGAK